MIDFAALLNRETKPALGVTEVGAIALAAARAYHAVGGELRKIEMQMNGGLYKNAFSCAIPGTEELGCEMAAALGALGGEWELGLECLKKITPLHVKKAKELHIPIEISVDNEKDGIFIQAEITTSQGLGLAQIKDIHNNITLVKKDGIVLYENENTDDTISLPSSVDFNKITIGDMVEFVDHADCSDLVCIEKMIDMNITLSKEGEKGVGLAIGKTLDVFLEKGLLAQDMIYAAQKLTCSAMDARLSGLPFPAMSIVGSGSHGILCSLPVVSYGITAEKSHEEILRAVALSGLVTIFSKHYTGRLSALCGCVLGGGSGAAAGIVYLMGGREKEVSYAINHMAANLTGMICDGGSTGCVLKASAGIYSAFLSAMLAMNHTAIPHNFGVIGSSAEQTAKNLGRVSAEGMAAMDTTVIDIMKQGK